MTPAGEPCTPHGIDPIDIFQPPIAQDGYIRAQRAYDEARAADCVVTQEEPRKPPIKEYLEGQQFANGMFGESEPPVPEAAPIMDAEDESIADFAFHQQPEFGEPYPAAPVAEQKLPPPPSWRCFHCGDWFLEEQAKEHFGARGAGKVPDCAQELVQAARGGREAAIKRAEVAESQRDALQKTVKELKASGAQLSMYLAKANTGFEEYERKFYLAQDRAEAAESTLASIRSAPMPEMPPYWIMDADEKVYLASDIEPMIKTLSAKLAAERLEKKA
jgi:hypothetical protein